MKPAAKATPREAVVGRAAQPSRGDSPPAPAPPPEGPELVLAFVGGIGTPLEELEKWFAQELTVLGYRSERVRLSHLLATLPADRPLRDADAYNRYEDLMRAGDSLRESAGRNDAVALLGITAIWNLRQNFTGNAQEPARRTAYLLRGLKTPEEVETLRNTYGGGLLVISAFQSRIKRKTTLAERIAESRSEPRNSAHDSLAEALIARDDRDSSTAFGQNVRDTFHRADVFLNLDAEATEVKSQIRRVLQLVFGYEFTTPSRDEHGMFMARAGSLRSAEMGRQVGAAICDGDGNVLAVGVNELPKPGGGLVWSDDPGKDARDWSQGADRSDEMKQRNLIELLRLLQSSGFLHDSLDGASDLDFLARVAPSLSSSRIMNAIEFGRAVHAETAAIIDAARRGVSVQDATMYVTTFPCHHCARHIVAAGIRRLVFIEPYPKSLAVDFHDDAFLFGHLAGAAVRAAGDTHKVECVPFVGVSPRSYVTLFSMRRRKERDGTTVRWEPSLALPRWELVPAGLTYLQREARLLEGALDLDKFKVQLDWSPSRK